MLTDIEKVALEALNVERDSDYENIAEATGLSVAFIRHMHTDLVARAAS